MVRTLETKYFPFNLKSNHYQHKDRKSETTAVLLYIFFLKVNSLRTDESYDFNIFDLAHGFGKQKSACGCSVIFSIPACFEKKIRIDGFLTSKRLVTLPFSWWSSDFFSFQVDGYLLLLNK